MRGNNFIKRGVCPECAPKSKIQQNLYNWVQSLVPSFLMNKRVLYLDKTQNGNKALEIDIYEPNLKIGVEVHGLYYHTQGKVGNLHQKKAILADQNGIQLLQFFEDEINTNELLVKSMIRSKLHLIENKINARDCDIEIISNQESEIFLEKNHLQGHCRSFLRIGLKHKDELIALITFRMPRKGASQVAEIARFCIKADTNVMGGFAKLLKRGESILKNLGFVSLITYSDRRYSNGNVYKLNGFTFKHFTKPDWFWFKDGIRYPRQISWGKTKRQMIDDKYEIILGAGHVLWTKHLK
jgi:hypothetical protein